MWIAALLLCGVSLNIANAATAATAATVATAATEPANADAAKLAAPTYAERLERGKQLAGSVCLACHGADGYSPIPANPNLAGMPAEYIAKQLEYFKSGKRVNAIMQGMSAGLTPEDMKAVGDYYFAQRGNTQAVASDMKKAERGQQIYRVGIPEAKVPACAGCHGAAGVGIPAAYPRLSGQWPDYTLVQLKAYASGERKNTQMNAIAARIKESDLLAVSEYIAGMRPRAR
ncbi:MAG: cytochrome c4 [Aeromicrobium sp.]|nr:cytochrome c4 [Burkholderiales bacterium]